VIDVGQNVEQKSMNFSYFFYKTGWKFIAWKLRKNDYVKFQVIWMQVTYFVLLLILYIALKILGSHSTFLFLWVNEENETMLWVLVNFLIKLTMLCWKSRLVIDWFLNVSHYIINILRCWQSWLFAFFIHPLVLPKEENKKN
jgi:hypothetical protein